jgi:hypothetical protein
MRSITSLTSDPSAGGPHGGLCDQTSHGGGRQPSPSTRSFDTGFHLPRAQRDDSLEAG